MGRNLAKIRFPLPEGTHFDEIVDVRSPSEFARDHVTGAVNLPVLGDEERARVGTIHKQESTFEARKIGAGLVAKNISRHIEEHFSSKPQDYRPLLYCWRGGHRSGSLATVLGDIGWSVAVVEGGYKTYRQDVVDTILEKSESLRFILLNGFTGAGKTLVLKSMSDTGHQVLDLEDLANHKGSVFGGDPDNPQPAQKRFESLLYDCLRKFTPDRPVFLEAESAKIGRLNIPNPLWQRMKTASVIEISTPLKSRAEYLTEDYREWLGDEGRIKRTLGRLRGFHSHDQIAEWEGQSERGEWFELVSSLLAEHYDKRYSVAGSGYFQAPSSSIELTRHDAENVRRCAATIVKLSEDLP